MTRQLTRDAGVVTTVSAVVVGAGIAAWAVGGVVHERNQLRAQAGQAAPQPTVTVTTTPAGVTPAPSPRTSHTASDVAAAEPAARPTTGEDGGRTAESTGRGSGGSSSGGLSTALRPRPAPSATSPTHQSSGSGLSASVRLPLGVLPSAGITIGGSR